MKKLFKSRLFQMSVITSPDVIIASFPGEQRIDIPIYEINEIRPTL